MSDVLATLRQYRDVLKNGSVPSQMTAVPLYYAMIENLLAGKPSTDSIVSFAADYTARPTDSVILIDSTDADRIVTLPKCTDVVSVTAGTSKLFFIKKTDSGANTITVVSDAEDTIEGASELVLDSPFQSVVLTSDGNDWYVLATNAAGGGGGTPSESSIPNVPYLQGVAGSGYTAAPADMPGGDDFAISLLMRISDVSVSGDILNYTDGTGGYRFYFDGMFHWQVMTSSGTREVTFFPPSDYLFVHKWIAVTLSYSGSSGSSLIEMKFDGRVISGDFSAVDGTYTAPTGVTPTILAGQGGADAASGCHLEGVAYSTSSIGTGDAARLFDAFYHAGQVVQVDSVLARAWSTKANTPGATWVGSVGNPTALTRIGGALPTGNETYPLWL